MSKKKTTSTRRRQPAGKMALQILADIKRQLPAIFDNSNNSVSGAETVDVLAGLAPKINRTLKGA